MDKKSRSLVKSISWRVLATLTTVVLVYIFTGGIKLALSVGFFEVILKMLIYYGHERVWDNVTWGKK
jgi:uncharacterized membrane protein